MKQNKLQGAVSTARRLYKGGGRALRMKHEIFFSINYYTFGFSLVKINKLIV